jgi:C_GCAxxG_C_C family probable redox protein
VTETELVERARTLFLADEGLYGCAEVTLLTLAEGLGLPGDLDSSVAMGLNGGVAYSGEICGALSGAAVAFGMQAGSVEPDHVTAKSQARAATAELIEEFRRAFGSVRCRDLSGYDLSSKEKHDAFMSSGVWKTVCMRQIEFSVTRAASIAARRASEARRPEGAES